MNYSEDDDEINDDELTDEEQAAEAADAEQPDESVDPNDVEAPPSKDAEDMESEDLGQLPKKAGSDDDAEQEVDDSEEIARNVNEAMPELDESEPKAKLKIPEEADELMAPKPSSGNSQLDKFQQYMDEYKKLQERRQKNTLINGLFESGAMLGNGLMGISGNTNVKMGIDHTPFERAQKVYDMPVQDFEQRQVVQGRGMALQQDMAAHDPASPQSRMVRSYLSSKLGMQLGDDVSAADAQFLLKTIGRPATTKFQKVNGTVTDEEGNEKRISATFDPATGKYRDSNTGKELPNFLAEGLNPFQVTKGEHGEQQIFNKSRGKAPTQVKAEPKFTEESTPQQIYNNLKPELRKELDGKIVPQFNKLTEKTQQRMMHEAPIMAKLQEAQLNPAAYAQLQAELARFDVGDQRLAQQEFNMFAIRHGASGWGDWIQKHSTGTISADFADDFAHTIHNTIRGMQEDLNHQAEKSAQLLNQRLPEGQKIDVKKAARLIYSGYKPLDEKKKASGENPNEIKRKTADGRIAIFDKNKKFLRYDDEQPKGQ